MRFVLDNCGIISMDDYLKKLDKAGFSMGYFEDDYRKRYYIELDDLNELQRLSLAVENELVLDFNTSVWKKNGPDKDLPTITIYDGYLE